MNTIDFIHELVNDFNIEADFVLKFAKEIRKHENKTLPVWNFSPEMAKSEYLIENLNSIIRELNVSLKTYFKNDFGNIPGIETENVKRIYRDSAKNELIDLAYNAMRLYKKLIEDEFGKPERLNK